MRGGGRTSFGNSHIDSSMRSRQRTWTFAPAWIEAAAKRLPNTLTLLVDGADGRMLVTRLDMLGLECSAGSACSSGAVEASHVLMAMGFDEVAARGGLRLSLGRNTSRSDCKRALDVLVKEFSPLLATRNNSVDL